MLFDVKLDRDFERYFNHLLMTYGEEMAVLNGFGVD